MNSSDIAIKSQEFIIKSSRPEKTVISILFLLFSICLCFVLPDEDQSSFRYGAIDSQMGLVSSSLTPAKPGGIVQFENKELALIEYVSKRWYLDKNIAMEFVGTANKAASIEAVDPLLILAIIATESSFSNAGNAGVISGSVDAAKVNPLRPHGPMQVSGRWHAEKMPLDTSGQIRATTLVENIFIGTKVIGEYLRREGGNLKIALQRYNGNINDSSARYSSRVLRFRSDFERITERSM